MALKFKLELDFVIGRDSETRAIEVARQHCARPGVTTLDRSGQPQSVPVEEFLEGTEQALLELLEHHPLLGEAGVGIERMSCRSVGACPESAVPDFQADHDSTPQNSGFDSDEQIDEEEIDEFESALYLCRWPNGDFSVV
jgi:hypothetical protein